MAGSQKNRKNISLSEEEKKAILDKVTSSDKPIAEALRELGISRSTFYSWLSRYQTDGEEGLKDKRGPLPADEFVEPEVPAAPIDPEISDPAPTEKKAEAVSAAASAVKPEPKPEIKKEELRVSSSEAATSGGKPMTSRKSTNFSLVATLAIIFVVAGFIISLCMWNSSKYFITQDGSQVTLWKGKFAIYGKQLVPDFAAINIGNDNLEAITGKTYYGEWGAVNALFEYMLVRADAALDGPNGPNYAEANRFLALAESVAYKGEQKSALNNRYARLYYTLAKKKVNQTEKQLIAMYADSIDVLEQARDMGLYSPGVVDNEITVLKSKLNELRQWNTNFSESYLSTKPAEVAVAQPAEEKPEVAVVVIEEKAAPAQKEAVEKEATVKEATVKEEAVKEEAVKEVAPKVVEEKEAAPAQPVPSLTPEPIVEAPKTEAAPEVAPKVEEPAASKEPAEQAAKAETETAPAKSDLKFEAVPAPPQEGAEPAKQETPQK